MKHLLSTEKRATILTIGLVLLSICTSISCAPNSNTENLEDSLTAESPPGPSDRPLQVQKIYDSQEYQPGQNIEIELKFTNIGPETITIHRFPPEMEILSREFRIVDEAEAGQEELDLKPGTSRSYIVTWDQQDGNDVPVSPGLYRIQLKDIVYTRHDAQRTTTANFGEGWFVIRYPQGAAEQTIELNAAQTADTTTITLEKIELSSEGSVFRFFFIPPVDMYGTPEAHAEYAFDGITRDAGFAGYGSRDNGFRLVWGSDDAPLDPIPSDIEELTFTITQLNGRTGPWTFTIPVTNQTAN